jgi:cytochrome c oxidase subunit 3
VPDNSVTAHGASERTETAHEEHPAYLRHHFNSAEQQADAAGFAMWLFLLTEVMFFGGLFTAYLVYRNWYYPAFVSGSHQLNVVWGTTNTAVLIFSSFTMAMGVWCAQTRRRRGLVLCLALTFILGLIFWASKLLNTGRRSRSITFPDFTTVCNRFLIRNRTLKFTRSITTSRWCRTWRGTPSFISRSIS